MASKIVRSHLFPVGTAVGAYPLNEADVERREGRVPIPNPIATGVVGSEGTVEFTGLTAGVSYVMAGFVDELQQVKVDATAGQFKLTFSGQQTGNVAFNATAAKLREELEALSNIAPGDVGVSGGPGDSGGTTPYLVKFLGTYAGTNVAAMTGANGTTPLSGGGGAITISTKTEGSKADEGGVQRTTVFTA
jgi:hypothetical protein